MPARTHIREDVSFDQPFRAPPKIQDVVQFIKSDTTPSVLNAERFKCETTTNVTITNFDDGAEGQEIKILGDSHATISNNSTIQTNTGANKTLVSGKVYTFTKFGSKWYEDE